MPSTRGAAPRSPASSYEVELKVYDTRCNAAEGASAMQRFANIDKTPAVLGELCSPVAAAEGADRADFQMPLIITVATAPNITDKGNPYIFRINANNNQLTKALAAYVASRNLTPLSFIAWNNDAGRGGLNGMRAELPKSIEIGYVGYFNVGEVDFSSHIANIRNSKAKAVMLLMDEEPGALAIKQIRDAGLTGRPDRHAGHGLKPLSASAKCQISCRHGAVQCIPAEPSGAAHQGVQ